MKRTPAEPPAQRAKPQRAPSTKRKPPAGAGKGARSPEPASSQTDPAVIALLRDLDHPLKREIDELRQIILGLSPDIREEIKWNAPSFRTTEHFATFNFRTKDRVRLILHTGAKPKDTAAKGMNIEDPAGLLEWLAKDRALVTFTDGDDIQAKQAALKAILRAWVQRL